MERVSGENSRRSESVLQDAVRRRKRREIVVDASAQMRKEGVAVKERLLVDEALGEEFVEEGVIKAARQSTQISLRRETRSNLPRRFALVHKLQVYLRLRLQARKKCIKRLIHQLSLRVVLMTSPCCRKLRCFLSSRLLSRSQRLDPSSRDHYK